MTRIAFVNGWNRALSWFFYAQGMSSPPYGMCRAATVLAMMGHDVRVFDGQALREDAERLAARVAAWEPDDVVVGALPELHIHVFMGAAALPYDLELARAMRDAAPRARVRIGGYLPALFPREVQALAPWLDGVVREPADVVAPWAGSPARDCGVDWEVLEPDVRTYGIDRWLHLDSTRRDVRPVLPVLSATGCSHRCTFCATPVHFRGRHETRPIEAVLAEIERGVRSYGVRAWSVWDDTFTVRRSRVEAFCRGLVERELDVRWWCFGHAAWVVRHADLLPRLREAGCRMMWLGVESVDPERQRVYQKGTDISEAMRAVDLILEHGILPTTSFLLGEPDDDRVSLERRIRTADRFLGAGALNVFTLLIPVPGTRLFADLAATHRLRATDLRLYSGVRSVVRYPDLDPETLEQTFFTTYSGSVLSQAWADAFGRANLWETTPGSATDRGTGAVAPLAALARAEYEQMRNLESGAGAEVDACQFRT